MSGSPLLRRGLLHYARGSTIIQGAYLVILLLSLLFALFIISITIMIIIVVIIIIIMKHNIDSMVMMIQRRPRL